ncbi:hypothetical protein SVIO_007170 [Streptomyces violaceusniger]|uniref:Uncharacterized protein n=1 Tax=Streptomyces violaceusniger TaxID=68280 RepID=A0A4D4KPJ0_STRVO|nr:hypothetical protein SVIO_007170 [Streptomyces violaceusniger]
MRDTDRGHGRRLRAHHPHPDICELTARQLTGEDDSSDLQDDKAYDLAWAALLRMVERIAPDYKD